MKKIGKKRDYGIRKGYRHRTTNEDYPDDTSFDDNIIFQPHVYEFVGHLGRRSGAKYIIDIGAGNGEKLIPLSDEFDIIAVETHTNLQDLKKNLPGQKVILHDLEKGLPEIDENILKDSIVVSSDVIEHLPRLEKYLQDLSKLTKICPFVVISTPDRDRVRGIDDYGPPINQAHVREWTASELHGLLHEYGFSNLRTGYTVNTNVDLNKTTILCLSGADNVAKNSEKNGSVSTLAIMSAYNEEDIIEHSVMHVLNQGMDVHVIDNWSTDDTPKILASLCKKYPDRITLEKFPKKKTSKYEWEKILNRVDEIGRSSQHDWILHYDADELRYPPVPGFNISEALAYVESKGYNSVDFTVLNFRPVDDDYDRAVNIESQINFFEFGDMPGHFMQIKAWKRQADGVNLSESGGHEAKFDKRKVYPIKFLLKHYPLRSSNQANKKINKDRKPRFLKEERKRGWHVQYDGLSRDDFIYDKKCLTKFHPIMFWQEHIIESASGIGLDQKSKD